MTGNGCPQCIYIISKWEHEVFAFVKEILPNDEVKQSVRKLLVNTRREIDIWIPSKRIGIECDGIYWYSDKFESGNTNTIRIKQEETEISNIRLINIFEDEWKNKENIAKSRIRSVLNVKMDNSIYARKCSIKQIYNKEAKDFLDKNHLQGGNSYSSWASGLFYENELVSVMTFCKPRIGFGKGFGEQGEYELLKFASLINTNIIGAASRHLKFFIRNNGDVKKIYSFADRRWSRGLLYEKLGFVRTNITQPSYFYIVDKKRKNRFMYRKSILVEQGFDPNKSESQIMKERGISRIYDAGTYKYCLEVKKWIYL